METVADGIHQVGGFVNAFIVDGDQGVVLIDSGLPKKEGLITDGLAAIGRSIADVVTIVLTHSHSDHIGSAAALQALSGAEVIASRIDTPAIQGEEPIPAPPMLRGSRRFLTGLFPKPTPVMVDHITTETEPGPLPDDLRAIDTPGHTPGHTSFLLDRAGGIMFVGDAATVDTRGKVTRGWFNARGGPEVGISIRHLAEYEFGTALFGHSPPISERAAQAFRSFTG